MVPETVDLNTVTAFLRLGKKYEISHLRNAAIARLKTDIPRSLDGKDGGSIRFGDHGHWFDLANLCREENLLMFLPYTYSQCCENHTVEALLRGESRGDDTLARLSEESRDACILAYNRLHALGRDHILKWLDPECVPVPSCRRPAMCFAYKSRTRIERLEETINSLPDTRMKWRATDDLHLCEQCRTICQAAHKLGQLRAWNALPSIFGLPEWEDLLTMVSSTMYVPEASISTGLLFCFEYRSYDDTWA